MDPRSHYALWSSKSEYLLTLLADTSVSTCSPTVFARISARSRHPAMLVGTRLTPAPRAALLARDRTRSDDLEAGDDPDPVRPPAEPPIHLFTGTFADAEHTVAYQSKAFG